MRHAVGMGLRLAVAVMGVSCGDDALHSDARQSGEPTSWGDWDTVIGDSQQPSDSHASPDVDAPTDSRGDDLAVDQPPVAVPALGAAWVGARLQIHTTVGLDGSASVDPEGMPLSFAWRIIATPLGSGVSLTGPATVWPMLTPDLGGDYTVALTVTDVAGLTDTKTLTFTVEAPYTDAPFTVTVVNYTLSGADCFTVSPVLTGSLTIDRNDPSIVFHFNSSDFVGTIDGQAHFAVELYQEFNYADGCHWGARDRLVGAFTTPNTFWADHSYTEWVIISDGACAPACVISSRIEGMRQ